MQQILTANNFQLFIPLGGAEDTGFAFSQTTTPCFGLTLTKHDTHESWFYQIDLFLHEDERESAIQSSLSWAKRTPYRFQKKHNSSIIDGLVVQIRINSGLFDFRRIKERVIRFNVQCFSSGNLLSQGSSALCQLLPKRRVAEDSEVEEEVAVVPIEWLPDRPINPIVYQSSEEPSPQAYSPSYKYEEEDSPMVGVHNSEGSYDAFDSDENILAPIDKKVNFPRYGSEYGEYEFDSVNSTHYYKHESNDNNQYMVLYNGNAEVIGNFRALNFYKASDINIKEDIRLLTEDRDPRGVLLQIDGVEYKFKEGLRGNTDANKRFVGYIAQQIESVVPSAVQLIDGILHVDYESLIPYLSESIKQNFKDINNLNSKTDQIHQVVDMMYNEFINNDKKAKSAHATASRRTSKRPYAWIIAASVSVAFLITVAVGVFFVLPYMYSVNSNPPSSTTTPPSSPDTNPVPVPPLSNEHLILADLFNATRGPYWTRSINWLNTTLSVCHWAGVNCDTDGRVIELILSNNDMRGTLPASIGDLERLQVINFSLNSIGGTIPATIGKLKNLRSLNLVLNHFRGTVPVEISMLTELQSISLSSNLFDDWQLPVQWQQLTKLKHVNLDSTGLVGTIPDIFGAMTQLSSLSLYYNLLEGTVPSLINTNISTLKINSNKFSGNIPLLPSQSLQLINLQNNSFTGGLENINNITSLQYLTLSNNNFQGEFWLRDDLMSSLKSLNIAGNHFTSVPASLTPLRASVIMCSASDNDFKCPLPDWLVKRCKATCA